MTRIPEIKGERFLVTGAAGFIGSHIAEELARQGKTVVCIDDLSAGSTHNLSDWWNPETCTFVKADITSPCQIRPYLKNIDVVFHEAVSKCTVCKAFPHKDLMVNAMGTFNVIQASIEAGVKKIVHASTGSVYGDPIEYQHESHRLAPKSFYGVSKLAAEGYYRAWKEYCPEFRYSILRYFHVYGPRQESGPNGGVVAIFIRNLLEGKPIRIFGDGKQVRFFTYVKDLVAANFHIANRSYLDGWTFNAASPHPCTVENLAYLLIDLMNPPKVKMVYEEARKGDIKEFRVRTTKITEAGISFPTTLKEGLLQTIESYKERYVASQTRSRAGRGDESGQPKGLDLQRAEGDL